MKIGLLILIMVLLVGGIYLFANFSQHSTLGSNQQGYVTKDVYSHYGNPNAKIAVITGMHPREDLATYLVPQIVKIFALFNKVEIVDYHVTVTDQPQDYDIGRENGQDLVAQYVIPDIETTDYELVIIAHDHESGYGEGYYIATPTHDSKSVALGEIVSQLLPQFNYYPGSSTRRMQSSSISQVDRPLTSAGYPVFVYEIPEWDGQLNASINTYKLFGASFNALQDY